MAWINRISSWMVLWQRSVQIRRAALQTLETIEYCTNEGMATICGLSNISFGLPDRSYINSVFLALAISKGLTMAIANPSQELLMRCGAAADLLMGKASADLNYIQCSAKYSEVSEKTEKAASKTAEVTSQKTEKVIEKAEDMQDTLSPVFAQIKDDVLSGYKNKIKGHIEKALSDGIKHLIF